MEITEQYSVNDGEYTDYSPYECIQYMLDDMDKEDIVGYKLNILKLEPVLYKGFNLSYLMEVIDAQFGDDRYDEDGSISETLEKVFKKHINFETLSKDLEKVSLFYDSGEYYTITEDDYEEVVKDM